MSPTNHTQIRYLSTAELQKNVKLGTNAFSSESLFICVDELDKRGELYSNPLVTIKQYVALLNEAQLNAVENNESQYSQRSLQICISTKVERGLATLAWYYGQNNAQLGPLNRNQLSGLAKNGIVQPTTLVWREGMADWVEAKTIRSLIPSRVAAVQAPVLPPRQVNQQAIVNLSQPQYAAPVRRKETPGRLIAAGVIQFMLVPFWAIAGVVQTFSLRFDGNFSGGHFTFFICLAMLGVIAGIGVLTRKRWSLWIKIISSATVIPYIGYQLAITDGPGIGWGMLLILEITALILVISGSKSLEEDV